MVKRGKEEGMALHCQPGQVPPRTSVPQLPEDEKWVLAELGFRVSGQPTQWGSLSDACCHLLLSSPHWGLLIDVPSWWGQQ